MLKVKEDGLNIIFMLIQNFKELVFEFFNDELKSLLPSVRIGLVRGHDWSGRLSKILLGPNWTIQYVIRISKSLKNS